MTINISNNDPRINYTATAGQTVFTVPFEFFDNTDIKVYIGGTLKTITTHYTVSGGNGSTGTVTLVTGATLNDEVTLVRDVPMERTTDLTSSYNGSSIDAQLDRIVAQIADLDDKASRTIQINDYELASGLLLPALDNRKGKTIQFNTSTGALEVGPTGADLTAIGSVTSEIATLAGISGNITTVAGANAAVTAVGNSMTSVNAINAALSNVNTVAGGISNINLVGGSISDVNDVADSLGEISAVQAKLTNIDTVAVASTNIGTVAGSIAQVNSVASKIADVTGVNSNMAAITTANANSTNVDLVANNIDDVNDIGNVITKVTTVADNIGNVNAVGPKVSEVSTVAASINSIDSLAVNITAVQGANAAATSATTSKNAAATSATNAATSATNAATSETNAATSATTASTKASEAAASFASLSTEVSDAQAAKTAAETAETNAETAETNASASATAASNSATSASTSASTATTKASEASTSATTATTKASEAATSASNASTSASTATTKASEASTSASNAATSASSAQASKDAALAALDSFDDRYLGQKSNNPTVDNDGDALIAGALYFNTTDDTMKVYEGSSWVAAYASLSGSVLQTNNLSDLTSATDARANLGLGTAATTASSAYATAAQGTTADNALPKSGGAMTGAITTNSTFDGVDVGQLKTDFDNLSTDIINDTSPQLGGALDVNGHSISFGDNEKARFGNADDLEIYHDGGNSYIKENGSGALALQTNGTAIVLEQTDGENMILANVNSDVKLYYDGSEKLATTSTGVNVTGSVAVSGTVDGRDVAADGTKLDGIESGATADQTNAEIRAAVEAATNSNVFTDADHTKLNGIETSATADQTITAGSGLSGGGTGNVTLSHSDTSSQASVNGSGRTYIQDITLDTYGHVTGLATATETVVNTDTNTTYSAGTDLSLSGTTFNHADTSALSGTYGSTSDGTKIDQITVDARGHVTAITTGATGDIQGVTAGSGLSGGGTSGTVTISHPTTAGNKHIPSGGASGQVLGYSSSGTAVWTDPAGGASLTFTNAGTWVTSTSFTTFSGGTNGIFFQADGFSSGGNQNANRARQTISANGSGTWYQIDGTNMKIGGESHYIQAGNGGVAYKAFGYIAPGGNLSTILGAGNYSNVNVRYRAI